MDEPIEPVSPPSQKGSEKSWGGHMQSGAFWMISLRWAVRLTGLVSTVILARLLLPHDFGIVAMAMVVVGTLEVLNETGQKLALIRLSNPTKDHYDSAWTISALIGAVIALTILVVAPLCATYFHEPRAVLVMQCLALRAVLGGVENIGTIDFRRDLRFDRFFVYNVCPKLASFVVTVTLAFAWRNYWALVAGMLTGQLTQVCLSYAMHRHRPRFTFSKVYEIWSFSLWVFARAVGTQLHSQIDLIAVGGVGGSDTMGRYYVAADVASSPSREINEPIVAVLYPLMSKFRRDIHELRAIYLHALGWSAVICASASTGVALVSEDMTDLLLGPKWVGVAPLMVWLSLAMGLVGLGSGAYSLFDALDLPHVGARMIWLRLALLAAAVIPIAFLTNSVDQIAIARMIASAAFVPGLLLTVSFVTGISAIDFVRTLWRPLAAAGIMAVLVTLLNAVLPWTGPLRLAIDVVVGAVSFSLGLFAFWVASGQPVSPERDLIAFSRSSIGAFRHAVRRFWVKQ